MAGRSRHTGPTSMPYTGPGGHFTPGYWRPNKSSGKIAIPEGPQTPRPAPPPTVSDTDNRPRDPRTAANLAAKADALAPRRWTPKT